jgi:hypothetical protein
MGVPIRNCMDVVELERTGSFTVYHDRTAAGNDAVVLVNRIAAYRFHGAVESGLMKMSAIGWANKGAHQFHQAASASVMPGLCWRSRAGACVWGDSLWGCHR